MRRKLRLTSKISVVVLLGIMFLPACISTNKSAAKPGKTITIRDGILENENTGPVWLAYGLALAEWDIKHPDAKITDYYEREVYARTMAAKVWHDFKEKGAAPDTALDALHKVNDAGYMKEYVWFYLKKPEWATPSGLRLEEFVSWRNRNLVGHHPIVDPGIGLR